MANNIYGQGAKTPFTSVEAESGSLGGGATVVTFAPNSQPEDISSPELEASGHAYVKLAGSGQSVVLTNHTSQNITALNVRYCIPDSPSGGGITSTLDLYVNGTFRQAVTLNSIQTWLYESSINSDEQNQSPSAGSPHNFWDETHFFVTGAAITPGSTIMFKVDSTNTASFYDLDVVDLETPPAALSKPANSLSIVSYGAVPNNSSVDSTAAIQNCINAAQSSNQIVWIPAGTFYLNSPTASLSATGIVIQGAGMWYSTIYGNPPLPANSNGGILSPTSCTIQDVMFDSNARSAGSGDGNGGGLNVKGSNWAINRVWIQHLGAGIWADGNNGIVENCRSGCTWGDGININNGNGGTDNNQGNNLTVTNCFVRGSGDDGIAVNCGPAAWGCQQMLNPTVTNNTVVAPWWANDMGVYGGQNLLVQNNLLTDSVSESGLELGTYANWGVLASALITGNTLTRCGDHAAGNVYAAINLGDPNDSNVQNVVVTNNIINNSVFEAITMQNSSAITMQNNTINYPGTTGILFDPGATGYGILNNNAIKGVASGQSAFINATDYEANSPISAASYNNKNSIQAESCSEGGSDVGYITTGSYTEYNNVNLTDDVAFLARVSSNHAVGTSGGAIGIHLDSPTGTLIGTVAVPGTGGWQNWTTVSCSLNSGVFGYHNVYLVYSGYMNIEWFNFFANIPVNEASNYSSESNVGTQSCSEGGLNVDYIVNGSYTVYNSVNLSGLKTFYARVAGAGSGGSIQVRSGSATGTLLGTCTVPVTGGWQTWTTVNCSLTGATGTQNLYLVYVGGGGYLFNLEWFAFNPPTSGAIEAASFNSISSGLQTQSCSEGGLNVDYISNGRYTVYNNVNMTGLETFYARIASAGSGGNIELHLDSPTGTWVGTCVVPVTGGWQTWTTESCNLTASTGTHNLYLVYTGGSGSLFNLEWFDLLF